MRATVSGILHRPGARRPGGAWLACILLLAAVPVLAQSGAYDLSWNSVAGGGGTSSSVSGYSLPGAAGQPDAGWASGGTYTLAGGFWGGGAPAAAEKRIYLPLVVRED